tara:strand:- start:1 stop:114 length:114 start_codon:yes stop_codon:yes gene_type:complete
MGAIKKKYKPKMYNMERLKKFLINLKENNNKRLKNLL